jgi:twitching motility protein PilT
MKENGGADFAHVVPYEGNNWRFRVNLFKQLGLPGMVARKVEQFIPDFEGLYLPPVMEDLCKYDQGMVLLAGVTGSGKSTTIASMLNWVNRRMRKHLLTIEDPIEFVYTADKCLINQRELGMDVKDFHIAMAHAVREDPDIMLVGEMRDRETFETAIHAAETGHLVFGTIHASSAPGTIGRILDLFPNDMHKAIRSSMGFNMRAIVGQKLLKTIRDKPSRVPIVEIMRFNPTVRKLVLEGQDEKLSAAIRIGKDEGMQVFNDSLYYFVQNEFISRAAAFEISPNVEELKMMLKGIEVKAPAIL